MLKFLLLGLSLLQISLLQNILENEAFLRLEERPVQNKCATVLQTRSGILENTTTILLTKHLQRCLNLNSFPYSSISAEPSILRFGSTAVCSTTMAFPAEQETGTGISTAMK